MKTIIEILRARREHIKNITGKEPNFLPVTSEEYEDYERMLQPEIRYKNLDTDTWVFGPVPLRPVPLRIVE